MSTPVAYGIDFGTTNSAIAVAYADGSTEVLRVPGELTQTLIYLHRNSNRLVGDEAVRTYLNTAKSQTMCGRCALVKHVGRESMSDCRTFMPGGGCFDARLIAQVKAELANEDFEQTHSWATDFGIEDLVAIVLSRLKKSADAQLGVSLGRVSVGHPVRFAGADGPHFVRRQATAQNRLVSAAARAGFTEHVSLMAESKAAVAIDGVSDGLLLCLDFGGGTFDLALIDVLKERSEVLALNGVPVGGEEFDAKIFDIFVSPALGLDREFLLANGQTRHLPAQLRSKLRSLSGLKDLMSENLAAGVSTHLAGLNNDEVLQHINALVSGGAAWPMFQAIKQAKHDLTTATEAVIDVRAQDLSLQIPIDRVSFEAAISDDLNLVRYCIEDALEDAGVEHSDVSYVSRTGGSSQIPAFVSMVEALFPRADHVQMDPFTSVVQGLARHAYEVWAS